MSLPTWPFLKDFLASQELVGPISKALFAKLAGEGGAELSEGLPPSSVRPDLPEASTRHLLSQ